MSKASRSRRSPGADATTAGKHSPIEKYTKAYALNAPGRAITASRNTIGRLADYLSFYIAATWKLWRLPRHDIVMALTTPPLIALIALLVGRLRGMRVVALVQDVYPDVAVALGALSSRGLATRVFDFLNRTTLKGADRIVVLGDCMREKILEKVGEGGAARIDVIHNWADGSQITPLKSESNPFTDAQQLNDKFVVLFSGNLGLVNEFATVLEAARLLNAERHDVVFLFIGEGSRAHEIREFTRQHNLRNVRMLPYQPRNTLRYSLASGHVSLVTLAPGLAGLSVPSKTYGILATGRPVLFVGDPQSDVARLIKQHGCGAVVASGDSEALVRTISGWASDRSSLAALGTAARSLFESRFDRPHAVQAYLEAFNRCLSESRKHYPSPSQPAASHHPEVNGR
ncbi:MAG: glycosyltransferase family 4 protein [Pyrinomonadaceae bacterium]